MRTRLVSLALFPLVALTAGMPGCVTKPPAAGGRYEYSQAQMGLDFRITVYATDEATARSAVGAAYARIAALNGVLSDYDPDSELSRLAQAVGTGEWRSLSPDLWAVLAAAQRMAGLSDGAFDITVGPVVNLWRRSRRQQQLPAPDLLATMRARVGFTNLVLDHGRRAARLLKPEMRLDAGGIAKGYALDGAMAVLRQHGVSQAMIHAGGDIICGDAPPGQAGWRIELTGLEATARPPVLVLANQALATSGDLFQYVEIDGIRYSHIVDPRTGVGLTNRRLVHVVAPRGMTADALATALSVMETDAGRALLRRFPEANAQIVTGTGAGRQVWRSGGFKVR